MNGVILVSGGMDSLVTAAIAKRECAETFFLHINYGQKTEKKELQLFQKICEFYQPEDQLVVNIDYLQKIGGSSLTDDKLAVRDFAGQAKIPTSYVPFRNAHFLAIATSWAEIHKIKNIYIGAVEEDSSGYPDCRKSFYHSFQKAIDLGTKDETQIMIKTPVIDLSKTEIIKLGKKLGVPFELSWSCYKNNEIACGKCDSCVLRINAFKKAKIIDPISYEIEINWLE